MCEFASPHPVTVKLLDELTRAGVPAERIPVVAFDLLRAHCETKFPTYEQFVRGMLGRISVPATAAPQAVRVVPPRRLTPVKLSAETLAALLD